MPVADATERKLRNLVPFQKGQSGNPKGRPKGARNRLSEAFVEDLHNLWVSHGPLILLKVLDEKPAEVLKVIASLVPKDFNLNHNATRDFRALWEAMATGTIPATIADNEE